MITYVTGDIFYSPARALVIPVNTVGVMSKGVAYDARRFYPELFSYYKAQCQNDAFDIGHLLLYRTRHKWLLLLPVRRHFRAYARAEHIEAGLKKFVATYAEQGITSVSLPRLGAESDKLDWEETLRPLLEGYLAALPIHVYIHDDEGAAAPPRPQRRNVRAIRAWLHSVPEHISYARFQRDLGRLLAVQRDFQTLDEKHERFQAVRPQRGQGLNLQVAASDTPVYIPASALMDLWQYIIGAGYALPQNFPAGLDRWGRYLVGLLWNLKYLQPINLRTIGRERQVGLHYIAPAPRKPKVAVRAVTPQRSGVAES